MQRYGRNHRARRRVRAVIAFLTVVIALAFSSVAFAAPNDGMLGGPPTPDAASTVCPAGSAVTGLTGTVSPEGFGDAVGSVTAQCEGGAPASGTIGTQPGSPGSTSCPAGQVAVGIEGREGDFLDQIAVRCRAADLTGPTTSALPYGGPGGSPDGPYDCPEGQRLVALDGTVAGALPRHVQIRCAAPDAIAPEPEPAPKADGTLTIDANKGKVEKGRKVTLTGQLDVASNESCEPSRQIQIQRRLKSEDDSKFATFATVTTDATGNYSTKVKVKKTYFYRAIVAENESCDDEISNSQKVRVQKKKAAQEA
jgi:hypothetical protein